MSHSVRKERKEKRARKEKKKREREGESEPATFVIFAFFSSVNVCMESLEQKFSETHKGALNVETE